MLMQLQAVIGLGSRMNPELDVLQVLDDQGC